MSVRKVSSKRRTTLGLALEQSAKEILAQVKGDVRRPTRRIVLPKRLRIESGMSQAEFARAFCINPRTLQEWG